ncbi:nitrogenase iron protein NifH [Adlercreutzia sp. ZJ473]|uniref:nucleotide-binding protein n=1 Tax=Adlercreutzia sp. ZJ473 TaxID=2722822 RepID=UPI0015560506
MRRVAIYGKGGIGKSTTTCNVAAALAERGLTVLQIGCDPKSDSTRLLMGGQRIPTVLDRMRDGGAVALEDIVFRSASGVYCAESGGPLPGVGCAGRGVITAFQQLDALHAFDVVRPDVVLYDVLGDVVCGGFAMPLRSAYARHVLVVSSGEMMSLYAASNILAALRHFEGRGYAEFAGLVANCRNVRNEDEALARFCEEEQVSLVARIPRSDEVQESDEAGALCFERFRDSAAARAYGDLADFIAALPEAVPHD